MTEKKNVKLYSVLVSVVNVFAAVVKIFHEIVHVEQWIRVSQTTFSVWIGACQYLFQLFENVITLLVTIPCIRIRQLFTVFIMCRINCNILLPLLIFLHFLVLQLLLILPRLTVIEQYNLRKVS